MRIIFGQKQVMKAENFLDRQVMLEGKREMNLERSFSLALNL